MAHIVIIGLGCTLFGDQGFGVHLVNELDHRFVFPDGVLLIDGGTIGVHLVGTLAGADHVIAVDIVRRGGAPGAVYRLDEPQIIDRLKSPDHILQEAFIEALIHCRLLDRPPRVVLLGVEPDDDRTFGSHLTPSLADKLDKMIAMVLNELDGLGVAYERRA